MFMFIRHVLKI